MKILVLTEHDDCCGPMAAAFLRDYSEKLTVASAGYKPSSGFPPLMVEVMRECLIDMRGYLPKDVPSVDVKDYDFIYECPDMPCPADLDACRELCDYIKNEAFLFFRSVSSSKQ